MGFRDPGGRENFSSPRDSRRQSRKGGGTSRKPRKGPGAIESGRAWGSVNIRAGDGGGTVGLLDQFLESREVSILELVEVEAGLAGLVLAEFGHQVLVTRETRHDVDYQRLFAGRQAGEHPVALAARGVDVVVSAETDDAGAPENARYRRRRGVF